MADEGKRIALPNGEWVELGPMTGRDFLDVRDVIAHRGQASDADAEKMLRLLERRITAASLDVLNLTVSECLEIVFDWYLGVDSEAVPQTTGTD
jgi:hypothetical protein